MFGLGKQRTRLGEWLDERGIKQRWLESKTGLNKNTVRLLCNDDGHVPSGSTMMKIIKVLREMDPSVRSDRFWDV